MPQSEDVERIVAGVVEEVRRRLAERTASTDHPTSQPPSASQTRDDSSIAHGPRLVVLFTGGHVGLDEGIAQALALGKAGWRMDVVLSPRAEELTGRQRLAPLQEVGRVLGAGEVGSTLQLLEGADAVVVPVLTRNTATKLALLITDSLATNLLLQALAMGKPVVAAKDAADPTAALCACVGLPNAPPTINRIMETYFRNLTELGLRMVGVSELAQTVAATLRAQVSSPDTRPPAPNLQSLESQPTRGRAIITERDLAQAAPGQPLAVPADAIVTDLAREAAQRRGIEIRRT